MSKLRIFCIVLAAAFLVASPALTAPPTGQTGGARATDEHLFRLGRIPDDFSARVSAAGGSLVRTHDGIGVAVTRGLSDEEAEAIAGDGRVARDVELQWVPTLDELGGTVELPDLVGTAHDPTDASLFPFQWDMRIIHADDAWDAGYSGNPNVVVAVLDSGIDPFHPDLQGLVDFSTSVAFVPALTGPPAWVDDRYHGTHVAGTIVTNGIGTSGVAPHVRLMAVKVLNVNGSGSFGDIIAGIIHATDNGADIINMSLGVPGGIPSNIPGVGLLNAAVNRAINYANRHGVLVVSAAGNDALDIQHTAGTLFTPCENGAGICVAATGPTDALASYSNYGTSAINVAAPGGDYNGSAAASLVLSPCTTRSAFAALAFCASGDYYLYLDGTSMATPHVAGAAALLDAKANGAMRAAGLKTRLQQTADDLGKKGADPAYGKGRINVCALVGC